MKKWYILHIVYNLLLKYKLYAVDEFAGWFIHRVGINQRIRIPHIGYEFSLLRIRPCTKSPAMEQRKNQVKKYTLPKFVKGRTRAVTSGETSNAETSEGRKGPERLEAEVT